MTLKVGIIGVGGIARTHIPGWQASTVGVTSLDKLPANAQSYLARIEELAGVPVDIISTGPDREQTIVKQHPFG